MVKINYKCSSCGGKLTYKDGTTSLICSFCNKTYDNFIKVEDIDFNEFDKQFKFSYYNCPKCGFNISQSSFEKYGSCQCYDCKSNIQKQDLLINGFILPFFSAEDAKMFFLQEISSIAKYIPKEFLISDFKLTYLNSRLYDGVIIISAESNFLNKKIEKKYVFWDLIIPNSNVFSNNDKINFLHEKIIYSSIIFDEKIIEKELDITNMDFAVDKKSNLSFIEEACLNDFKSIFKNAKNIKVVSSLDIKDNIYVPVYQSKVVYDDKCYYNTIISQRHVNDNKQNIYCLNFPDIDLKLKKRLRFKYLCFKTFFIIVKLTIIIFMLYFLFNFLNFYIFILKNYIMSILVSIAVLFMIALVSLFPINIVKKLKKDCFVYFNSQDISDNKFYEELINKKNKIVGHIRWW